MEAQCAGWGPEWYPGVVRSLLPSGEVQVLWDGDEPSISNVSPALVRHIGGAPCGGAVATPSDGTSVAPVQAPPTEDPPAAATAAGGADGGGGVGRKHPAEEMAPSPSTVPAVVPQLAVPGSVAPHSYRYDLGPGDDVAAPVANLRRRVEAELRDGCRVVVALHISRPAGRPEVVVAPLDGLPQPQPTLAPVQAPAPAQTPAAEPAPAPVVAPTPTAAPLPVAPQGGCPVASGMPAFQGPTVPGLARMAPFPGWPGAAPLGQPPPPLGAHPGNGVPVVPWSGVPGAWPGAPWNGAPLAVPGMATGLSGQFLAKAP